MYIICTVCGKKTETRAGLSFIFSCSHLIVEAASQILETKKGVIYDLDQIDPKDVLIAIEELKKRGMIASSLFNKKLYIRLAAHEDEN